MNRRFSAVRTAAVALVLLASALSTQAFNLGGQRWRTTPVVMQLQLGSSNGTLIDGSTSWGASAEDALSIWNGVLTNVKFTVVRDSTATKSDNNRLNNVFFSPTIYGDAWDSRTLAITLSSYNPATNGFLETDVLFNTGISWNSYRGPLRSAGGGTTLHDLRRVALHEFGHALGLDHPDELGQSVSAIMNSAISNLDTLAADDINGARAIYDGGGAPTAPTITAQPTSRSVAAGSNTTFTVAATGTATLSYQWFKNSLTAIAGATAASLTLNNVNTTHSGDYTVVVSNSVGSVTSNAANLNVTAAPTALTSRLSNVSVRTTLATRQVLTVGFTMSGGSKNVLVRAAGPSLSLFSLADRMVDPSLTLFANGTQVDGNDNWNGSSAVASTTAAVGAFPFVSSTSLDAALVRSISGGNTVEVTGSPSAPAADTAGTVIVEVYDAASGLTPRLTNLSALNRVGTGANILIAGFTVAGTGVKNLLIRAVGPGLTQFNVGGVLADPKLELFNSAQASIGSNDTYAASLATTFTSVGAFALPAGSKDAALVVSLPPGGYTVQVSGADGGTGVAIVELYELP